MYDDVDPIAPGVAVPRDGRQHHVGRTRAVAGPCPCGPDDVGLVRKGDELIVSVASYRRLVTLPTGLARHRVAGARVRDGQLQVRFVCTCRLPEEVS